MKNFEKGDKLIYHMPLYWGGHSIEHVEFLSYIGKVSARVKWLNSELTVRLSSLEAEPMNRINMVSPEYNSILKREKGK